MNVSLPKVYLETSFISYLASGMQQRNSSDVNTAHRQLASALWWEQQRERFGLFVSDSVLRECSAGHRDAVSYRLQIFAYAEILSTNREIIELTRQLVKPSGPLPTKAETDATHIAFASVFGCDYLVTWNFKHIANAFLLPNLNTIVQSYGYRPSIICTPEQLTPGHRDL